MLRSIRWPVLAGVAGLCLTLLAGCGSAPLQIEDLKEGTGPAAQKNDFVRVHYTGRLRDGTKFDSSYDHPDKEPFGFLLGAGKVIKGWDQGIVGMKVGGKRKLTIPPDLAYGAEGRPPAIPPHSDLIFEVELVEID
jgi:FKBP-type peptidyl-prolyl cis-trans isomerase